MSGGRCRVLAAVADRSARVHRGAGQFRRGNAGERDRDFWDRSDGRGPAQAEGRAPAGRRAQRRGCGSSASTAASACWSRHRGGDRGRAERRLRQPRARRSSGFTDVAGSIGPLKHAKAHLKAWMRPEKRGTTPALLGLLRRQGRGAIPAQGRGRRDQPMELPGQPHLHAAGRRAGGRQPGDDQALGVHAGHLRTDGADVRRGVLRGRDRRLHRRAGGRPGVLGPGLRPSDLHRRDRRSPAT